MNEQELRSIVRAAVNRQLHGESACAPAPAASAALPPRPAALLPHAGHASHTIYAELVNVSDACVIEPAVKCDHCGYCKSQGY
jgi:hypothetical protein